MNFEEIKLSLSQALLKIPSSRLIAYAIFLGLLPLATVLYFYQSSVSTLMNVEEQLSNTHRVFFIQEKRQANNRAVQAHYRDADHFYIDKTLETLVFLESEIEELQALSNKEGIAQTEHIVKRLEALTPPNNTLQFSEGMVQSYPNFQETIETLSHPVEIDISDLKKILSYIENISIGSYQPILGAPQLIITEFKLDKKKIRENKEVFMLQLKLLKREFADNA